jgi:molybdopterin synthase catalytic subunit
VIALQSDPIRTEAVLQAVCGDSNGAISLFLGTVRNVNQGRNVRGLEYHAYGEMAEREMSALRQTALERFDITSVAIVHRVGPLAIGDTSVAIAVSAPHRGASFEACRWIIDTLKKTVPIWKKEFFEDGETWIEGRPEGQGSSDSGH